MSENAMKTFKAAHAEGIAATKAEFVRFLREGELPDESLDSVAMYIYVMNRTRLEHDPARQPLAAGAFFGHIVEDGIGYCIDAWDNPEKHAKQKLCSACDGDGFVSIGHTSPTPKQAAKPRKVRGV